MAEPSQGALPAPRRDSGKDTTVTESEGQPESQGKEGVQEGEASEIPLGLTVRVSVNEDSWRLTPMAVADTAGAPPRPFRGLLSIPLGGTPPPSADGFLLPSTCVGSRSPALS